MGGQGEDRDPRLGALPLRGLGAGFGLAARSLYNRELRLQPQGRIVQIVCLDMEGVLVPEIWITFAERHRLTIEVDELMRRTTGRTGAECMEVLFGRPMDAKESWALVHQKEEIYREL